MRWRRPNAAVIAITSRHHFFTHPTHTPTHRSHKTGAALSTAPRPPTAAPTTSSIRSVVRRSVLSATLFLFLSFLLLVLASTTAAFIHPPAPTTLLTKTSMSDPARMASTTGASATGVSGTPPYSQHAFPGQRAGPMAAERRGSGKEGEKKLTMTLGFLGGGMMASALIKGLIKAEVLPNFAISVSDPHKPSRDKLAAEVGVVAYETNIEVAEVQYKIKRKGGSE